MESANNKSHSAGRRKRRVIEDSDDNDNDADGASSARCKRSVIDAGTTEADDDASSQGSDTAISGPLPSSIELTERPDVAMLEELLVSPRLTYNDIAMLAAYARAARSGGGKVTVTYVRKGPGRLYPMRTVKHSSNPLVAVLLGDVAVNLSRRVRSALFGDTHVDVDIVNCQPRLLLALLNLGSSDIEPAKYAHLEEYVENRESVFAREGLDKGLAKKLVSIVLFGGSTTTFVEDTGFKGSLSPWWRRFVKEAKTLGKLVWEGAIDRSEQKQIKAYLASDAYKEAHPDRVDPDGTVKARYGARLAMVLQKRETDAVLRAILELRRREVPVESYQYDGFLVRNEWRAKVEEWMAECNTDEVEFVIKDFDEPLAPPPFHRFDPVAFELPADIEVGDVKEYQLRQQLRMERYIFKVMTPTGVVFVPDGPKSSHRDPRKIADCKVLFANVFVPLVKVKQGKDGPIKVVHRVPFFPWWLEQPSHRQYNDMQFRPPPLQLLDGHFNKWRGFKVGAAAGAAAGGDIGSFVDHCTVLMEGNAEWGEFLLDVLAHRVQRPGERTELALVFLGPQGTGKTGFFEHFCKALMYDHNYLITEKAEQITGKFHLLVEKILVLWEEAEDRDTLSAADRIKHLVTAEKEYTEKKGVDATLEIMCFLPIVAANHLGRRAINIEGSDRRFVVMKVDDSHIKKDPQYFEKLFSAKGGMGDPAFMRAVFDFLQKRDIFKYKNGRDWSKARPMSDTYDEMKRACADPMLSWFEDIAKAIEADEAFEGPYAARLDAILTQLADGETWSREFSASDVYPVYKEWLERHGYTVRLTEGDFRLKLGGVAGDGWLKKIKTSRGGFMRYKINTGDLVASLLSGEDEPSGAAS